MAEHQRRPVGRELKVNTKEALVAHELFSAMPPWECVKTLLSLLVTENLPGLENDELELAILDISRAHFMPKAERELYIELPPGDQQPGQDLVGRLNRMMHGFRDASNGRMRDWQSLLTEDSFEVGKANGALFLHQTRKSRGAVHGDDFFVLGTHSQLDEMGKLLASKYSVRESHRLGFGEHGCRGSTILNRVVKLQLDGGSRKEVLVMADQRHVEIVHQSLGLRED